MKTLHLAIIAIIVISGIVLSNTNLAFATNSKNDFRLSVGGREFVVSYDISNATVNEILVKKNLSYTNHYWYSLMIAIDNSTNSSGALTITLPSELMASTCQSGFYPKVSINNGTFNDVDEISSTKTNNTILIKFPPFTKNIGIIGYGPDPSSGCPTFAYNMIYDGKTYWIDYKSNPEIHDFSMDKNGSSLVVTLSHLYHFPPPQPWSYADIQIPRNLLDSKMGQNDVPFTVMVDGNMTQIQEIETTNTTRTIHIPLRGGLYYQDNGGEIIITGITTAPPNSMGTPNGGWVTPLQTTNSSGGKLDIHVEKGVNVSGKIMPPPVTANMGSHQQFQTPLKQFKSGIKAEDVKCIDGLTLVIKREDGLPACIMPDDLAKLVLRDWPVNPISHLLDKGYSTQEQQDRFFYEIMNLAPLKNWSESGWLFVGGNSIDVGDTHFSQLQLYLPPGSGSPKISCDKGWHADIAIDTRTLTVINATYPLASDCANQTAYISREMALEPKGPNESVPDVIFSPSNVMDVENSNFTISYDITGGMLDSAKYDKTRTALEMNLTANNNGDLVVTIPRQLLDSPQHVEPYQFFVMVDNYPVRYVQTTSATNNTLTIPFSSGTDRIEISVSE